MNIQIRREINKTNIKIMFPYINRKNNINKIIPNLAITLIIKVKIKMAKIHFMNYIYKNMKK